jgi:hypothetical protein
VLRRSGPLLLLATIASATVLVRMDVAALTRASTRVVRARVEALETRWAEPGRIVTVVQLSRLETWSGPDIPALRVLLPGGEVDGLAQHLEGVPALLPGEELVLFLRARSSAPGATHDLVGLAEGLWRVERTGSGEPIVRPEPLDGVQLVNPPGTRSGEARLPLSLATLRARVEAARSR